jgi:hypothetical protein
MYRYRRAVTATPQLAEIAEEPGLWLPDDGLRELIALDGLTVAAYGSSLAVERIRLRPGSVERALQEVRELARSRRVREVTWWIGRRAEPPDLEDRLLELGLMPDASQPELTTLTLEEAPAGTARIEVRQVASYEDYLRALEIDWEVFDLPRARREERRAVAKEQWRRIDAAGNVTLHLALVDGRPAAFARTVFTPAGGLMLGGATLAGARGHGAYTSLIHARWDEAVRRGTRALGTAAGSMSGPILRRLGFAEHGHVRLLADRL